MSLRTKLEIAALLIILAAAYYYHRTSMAAAVAATVKADMKPVHQEATSERVLATAAEQTNQAAFLAAVATLTKTYQQPMSAQQIDALIATRLGTLAQAKTTVPADQSGKPLPDAASTTIQTKALTDYMYKCDNISLELGTCKGTVTHTQELLSAEKKDHEATKKELASAREEAKGGGFWKRLKRGVKHSVCGGLGGGTGAVVGQRAGAGPGLAAAAGVFGGCELLTH